MKDKKESYEESESIAKRDNPLDFDSILFKKVWDEFGKYPVHHLRLMLEGYSVLLNEPSVLVDDIHLILADKSLSTAECLQKTYDILNSYSQDVKTGLYLSKLLKVKEEMESCDIKKGNDNED